MIFAITNFAKRWAEVDFEGLFALGLQTKDPKLSRIRPSTWPPNETITEL